MIPLYVGFDQREAIAYHTFCQSVLNHSSRPVSFVPLALPLLKGYEETHTDGSNAFIYSRFLVPHLQEWNGWAIFCDGDMLVRDDISKLWKMRDHNYAVMVAKHKYKTKHKRKYIGTSMETVNVDYERKNWSSVMLWNCEHPCNRILTPAYVQDATGRKLHRFEHLDDSDIGEIPLEWNWLAEEYENNADAKLVHYTLGIPSIDHYRGSNHSAEWLKTVEQVNHVQR